MSGALFNPATSVALALTENKNLANLILNVVVQYIGSFAGIFVTYLLAKYYTNYELYPSLTRTNGSITNDLLYFDSDGKPYWGRIIG